MDPEAGRGAHDEQRVRATIVGGRPLRGRYRTPGAKNVVLPMMAASLLTDETCVIQNVPIISDVLVMADLLRQLGAEVLLDTDSRTVTITAATVRSSSPSPDLAQRMRASFQVAGPLLARFGRFECAAPGGCQLGARPVSVDIAGFQRMGATVALAEGVFHAEADALYGRRIYLDYPSHTGTQNLLMAATLANGYTTIVHASREPEVVALVQFLRGMGAEIHGEGTSLIGVQGRSRLFGTVARAIPDRMVGGTMAIAAALTGGDVELLNVRPDHLEPVTVQLREMGVDVVETNRSVRVIAPETLGATDVQVMPFPGFPTDVQAPMGVLMTQAYGVSTIVERVFDSSMGYMDSLAAMGADVTVQGTRAVVRGPRRLRGRNIDLEHSIRGMTALALAGLVAEGETVIDGFEFVRRGYEDLAGDLRELGASITTEPQGSPVRRAAAAV